MVSVLLLLLLTVKTTTARVYECQPSMPNADQEEFETLANTLQPGDELIVHAGIYSQNGRRAVTAKGTPDHPIAIRAAEGELPLFTADPGNNCIEFVDCAHLVIRVVTQVVEKGSDTARVHYVDLSGVSAGSYEVYYETDGDTTKHLGRIDVR